MRLRRLMSGLTSSMVVAVASLALASTGCTIEARVGAGATAGGPSNYQPSSGGGSYVPAPAPMPNVSTPPAGTTPTPTPPPTIPGRTIVQIPRPNPAGGGTVFVPVAVTRDLGLFGGPNQGGALKGLVYFIPETTMSFPDVSNMHPSALVYTDTLNIVPQDYATGGPGVAGTNRLEFYAIEYTGVFHTSKGGTYQFFLNSSDGSKLYIDGKLVVDDDQRHTPKRAGGSIDLAPGQHAIRVDYFKAYRWVIALQLSVAPPGEGERIWTANL